MFTSKPFQKVFGLSVIAIAMLLHQTPCFADAPPTLNSELKQNKTSYAPFDEPCKNFNVQVDFLYWKANEDGLEYGAKMIATPLIEAASTAHMKLLDLDFNWDPGFRLGAAYNFHMLDDWTLQLNWTHINSHASGSTSAQGIESQTGNVNTIISPWVNLLFELRAGASHASAHWKLNYNTLDLDFGKNLILSKAFSLTPFFGFRGAWLNQDYKVKYDSVFLLAENAPHFSRTVTFKGKNDFHAFGGRIGTEIFCNLGRNWHLFSQLSGNLLYGQFDVHMTNLNDQGLGEGSIPPMPIDLKAKEEFWRVRLCFEEAIGFGWQVFFPSKSSRLRIRAGYELSQWLNQNELFYTLYFRGQDTVSIVPIRNQGNLSFQGIRIGAQYDF